MLGAICGDVIGKPYEFVRPVITKDFELFAEDSAFSDDTVLTAAIADACLRGRDFGECLVEFGRRHIDAGYSRTFKAWLLDDARLPAFSTGNGSAMRVSPVAWFAGTLEQTIDLATRSALPSHGDPEGIKGAVATASAVFLALEGWELPDVRKKVTEISGYDLSRSWDDIRADYPRFKTKCPDSVPEALTCAFEATSYEDAIRNAIALGNDADTQAAIAGAIAEPVWGVPDFISGPALQRLSPDIRSVYDAFRAAMHERLDKGIAPRR